MQKSTRARLAASVAALAVSGGLAVAASGTTGAYFSDTHSGTVSGTIGSIRVATGGGSGAADHLNLQFKNLLPGEKQTVTANYANTGTGNEDVWVVFNNADALHALNDLGRYGEVHIASNGTERFASANLNDNYVCGASNAGDACPVPSAIKLASNVAPGDTGSMDFAFNYSGKLQGQAPAGTTGVWNSYPVKAATPTGSGLPYQIVATQVGQSPTVAP